MSNMDYIVEDHSHTQEEVDKLMIRLVNIILESPALPLNILW